MRELSNFYKRGGRILSIADSITGKSSKSSYCDAPLSLWVRATYVDGFPSLSAPQEVWLLDQNERPDPQEGWAYAVGVFGS